MRTLLLAAFLAACATPPTAAPVVDAGPVIAAERAFAADAAVSGWIPAFRKFVAPDGVMLLPDPSNAPAFLARETDDGDKSLQWWPAYAGIARSGELGFTTGPVLSGGSTEVKSQYFTVWKKQPDGSWKWIYDGGVRAPDANPFSREQLQVPTLPTATGGAASPEAAVAEVQAQERAHATPATVRTLLTDNAHVNRIGAAPALNRDAAIPLFDLSTPDIRYTPHTAISSQGADLVFSLVDARWTEAGVARRGYAVRIWQWRPAGWRLVYDQLSPARAGS
jgi:hypothetical protein